MHVHRCDRTGVVASDLLCVADFAGDVQVLQFMLCRPEMLRALGGAPSAAELPDNRWSSAHMDGFGLGCSKVRDFWHRQCVVPCAHHGTQVLAAPLVYAEHGRQARRWAGLSHR